MLPSLRASRLAPGAVVAFGGIAAAGTGPGELPFPGNDPLEWAGYALLSIGALGVWMLRQRRLLARRRWIRRAAEVLDRDGIGKLRELAHHADFQDVVGDLTEVLGGLERRIGEERETRQELEGEIEAARRCFEALPLPGIILDGDGYLLAATPEACAFLGRSESVLVGAHLSRFVRGDLDRGSPCRVRVAGAGESPREAQLHLRSTGSPGADHQVGLFVEVPEPARPGTSSSGGPGPASNLALDAMAELAGSIAHDFNDQLTAILGHGYVLRGLLPPADPARESVEEISRAAEQARHLTQQLLAFSRRQVAYPETVDLGTFVPGAVEAVKHRRGDEMELSIEEPAEPVLVRADPVQLRTAVEGVVRNAREAMGGRGRLIVRVERVRTLPPDVRGPAFDPPDGDEWACLSFLDEGPGMDPDTLARAFDPYYTTHRTKGRRGMGLSTVYGIVAQNRGRIAAANAEARGLAPKGLVVEIYFPTVPSCAPVALPAPPRAADAPNRPRICVVEDDPQVRRLVVSILEREGYEVVAAENGREALQVCEDLEGLVDLVLTDVNMPDMGGLELAEEIRRHRPGTRTIFMSGFLDPENLGTGMIPATAFLQKPFTPHELVEHVRRGLSRTEEEEPPRVLVIDDEEAIREILRALLESLGYLCETARDGDEALRKLRAFGASVVLSDMVMPGRDGIRTCAEIRRLFPGIRIIAMSGKIGSGASLTAAENLGAVATLTKPFSRDELRIALDRAFERTTHAA
ncbi:MAG: response regulator [Planctomycetota bacterium]